MLRLVAVTATVALVTAALLPVQWIAVRFGHPLRRRIPNLYHRFLCLLLRVRVRAVGAPDTRRPLLIVANHASWIDIGVITSQLPVVFVAKSEVGTWPIFGLLARLQRTVFVERERRVKTREATEQMAGRLAEGDPVVLFAEGTSSDGNRILPFRSSLIGAVQVLLAEAAHAGEVLVQPLAIAYVGSGGVPLGRVGRPRIAWYGDMDLLPHLKEVVRNGAIDTVLAWGEPIPCGPETDRKALAVTLESAVRRLFVDAVRRRTPSVSFSDRNG